jgi:hypothetical protein
MILGRTTIWASVIYDDASRIQARSSSCGSAGIGRLSGHLIIFLGHGSRLEYSLFSMATGLEVLSSSWILI